MEARAWWSARGPALRALRTPPTAPGISDTVMIDLAARPGV
jgi:hypothetical protein